MTRSRAWATERCGRAPAPLQWTPYAERRESRRDRDLPPGGAKQVTLNGIDIALFNAGGDLCAVDNTCPHRGGPLSDGPLNGTTVVCPWHAWEFDVKTGACLNNPAAKLKTYPVQAQGDDVLVTI